VVWAKIEHACWGRDELRSKRGYRAVADPAHCGEHRGRILTVAALPGARDEASNRGSDGVAMGAGRRKVVAKTPSMRS